MNIFVLDEDPAIAAQMMCDKHIPKMIVETFQMLGSALRRHGATDEQMPLTSKGNASDWWIQAPSLYDLGWRD